MSKKEEKNKDIYEKLKKIGEIILQQVRKNQVPYLKVPARTTNNIVFDPKYLCYVLGDKTITRSAGNIRHVKPFAQLLKVASLCKELVKDGKRHITKRELYYISESWGSKLKFDEQPESDDIVEDIEALLGLPREDIHITPKPKGSIYGDITLRFKNPNGKYMKVNCLNTADGQSIGPRTCEAEFVDCKADKVIAIETDGMYNRLIEENAHEKFNAILINLGGQASRATRRIIKRLNEVLGLPVYIFTDGDPWGLHIAMVIMAGSAKSAHINKMLATPDAQWIGVTASDIVKYKLRSDKLKDVDFKRIKELKKDPRYKKDKRLQEELRKWEEIKKKAEQQALLKYGFRYVVDEYLPAKFKELKAPGFK
ncbi:MAG: DNA topoisomerase IV subunit A [Candidatus Aenigmarchaeota archaeon]|nr:DNA topoisomerase IV subunit A [Candidatus Aenigmarchaeota archaeon]